MITALFVQTNGAYFGVEGIDPWDEARDARLYEGNDPVIAHPPCARWCRLAKFVEKVYGHKVGDDSGCFASALANVIRCKGVLEHPAHTLAWAAHGMTKPGKSGWTPGHVPGSWVCEVEQGHYGHRARKATWLFVVSDAKPAELVWGPSRAVGVVISCTRLQDGTFKRPKERMSKKERDATPPAFKEVLLNLARSVK